MYIIFRGKYTLMSRPTRSAIYVGSVQPWPLQASVLLFFSLRRAMRSISLAGDLHRMRGIKADPAVFLLSLCEVRPAVR